MQKNLLLQKKYWPSFWTMFFGAFNDNVFKNALVVLITYNSYELGSLSPEMMVSLCGGVFILPFFLFSSISGQICDKYPKNKLMFYTKILEVIVMLVGAYGFISENVGLLIITLFFMGLQSTVFGPVKYSILPELLSEKELLKGNAYVTTGTFLSILLGIILGGSLIAIDEVGKNYVAGFVVFFAIVGTIFSLGVLKLQPGDKNLKIDKNIFSSMPATIRLTRKTHSIFLSILGLSWFWFLGAALLSMFPPYVKDYIGGDERVATLFMALFSIGVATGSIICSRISKRGLELGLVPFGTFGMSLFIFDLFLIGNPIKPEQVIGISEFLNQTGSFRIVINVFGLSVFSGFFTVPLITFIQQYSEDSERSRIISGLNIFNSLFMVVSAISLIGLYAIGLTIPQIFGIWALLNLIVGLYIYTVIPDFFLRFLAKFVLKFVYRLKVSNREILPKEGACILTSNHVSFIDWLVIYGAIDRPVRFIMSHKYHKIPLVGFLFKDAGVIPIAGRKENPEMLEKAMESVKDALAQGDIICIFPEGAITHDGELAGFRPGIEKMLMSSPVPVYPMALNGLWGSFFSRAHKGKALSKPSVIPRRWFSKVELDIYEAWQPDEVTAQKLEKFTRSKIRV